MADFFSTSVIIEAKKEKKMPPSMMFKKPNKTGQILWDPQKYFDRYEYKKKTVYKILNKWIKKIKNRLNELTKTNK